MKECAETLASEMTPAEVDFLVTQLDVFRFPGRHLEIGTAAGGTLWRMLKAVQSQPPFVVVDPMQYFPGQLDAVKRNLQVNGLDSTRVDFRVMTSQAAYEQARDAGERYDFILIDGVHKYRYVMTDLQWADLLKPGGVLALHDYCDYHQDVLMAVDRYLSRHDHFERIGLTESLLLLRKTAEGPVPGVSRWERWRASVVSFFLQLRRSLRKRLR